MELNQLYVRELLNKIRALSKMEHYHQFGMADLSEMNNCDLCLKMDNFINQLENQLGEDPKTASSTEEFIKLIQNDPLSKRLFDMGRKYEADRLTPQPRTGD